MVYLSVKAKDVTSADKNKSLQTANSAEANTEQMETCHTVNMSREYNNTNVPTTLLCQENGKPFPTKATADTGCSVTIIQDDKTQTKAKQ